MSLENREFESDSDSDFEGATHEAVEESFLGVTVLGQLMEPIKEVISMLLRTSMVIRKPAPYDHFANFNQVSTTHFEDMDLRHIQDKFPMASPTLVKRLARATSSRRNYLKKHVSKDLAPYVCTFDSCSTPFRRFEKRREWFELELSHRSKWKCPLNCDVIYDTQEDLSQHLKEHSGMFIDP
ncbi:uncharacterized protein IWZ02DRAFT_490676 [Phyllosticta citriasiana]|uniref:C2H2-type domain-containing protein n=1 Tax=Phyllosticta citriasiana TaxID=595635 RepID=A0ABR1KZN4_9PEZI